MAKFKIAYITVQAPFGPGEAFIVTEMLAMMAQREVELWIAPLRPQQQIRHYAAETLIDRTLKDPLFNLKVLLGAFKVLYLRPRQSILAAWKVFRHSRPGVLFKNLAVIPKGLYLGGLFREKGIQHIHAHWASTPSTCAYIAAMVAGIPWSFTAHRWDISENNMLKEKVRSAKFVRVISEDGKKEIQHLVSQFENKIMVIRMGVEVPLSIPVIKPKRGVKTIVCIANLVEKKGHRYLLEACALLKSRGMRFRCILVGDGPLRVKIQRQIQSLGLEAEVEMRGALPHGEVLRILREEADVVVLPSIVTEKGEKEGIPVALMEAMAAGVPVIATPTGGIPELLGDRAGIMVPPKSSEALAEALKELFENESLYREYARKGHMKVEAEFNLKVNTKKLFNLIKTSIPYADKARHC